MARRIVFTDPKNGQPLLYGMLRESRPIHVQLEEARKFLYRSFQGDEAMLVAKSVRIEEVKP